MEVDQEKGPAPGWTWADDAKPTTPNAGYWEDKGIAGKVWHPSDGATERNRVDNQVGGLPPELAAVGALGVGRAVAGASGNLAMKLVKGVSSQVSPIIKYEVVKTGLTSMGVPPAAAAVLAAGVSGLKGKSAPAATKAAQTAEESLGLTSEEALASRNATAATPPSAPQAAQIPVAPPAAQTTPVPAPQPAPVVAAPQATAPTISAPPQGPMQIQSAAELAEFHRMVQQGTPWQKALQLIVAQRGLVERMGLPNANAAADAVAARNAGRGWQ